MNILLFHQGYTDIINCCGLINYYSEKYDNLLLIIREDMKNFIDFYTKNIKNLEILYINKDDIYKILPKLKNTNNLFHGFCYDNYRNDNLRCKKIPNFLKDIYESYNINLDVRINYFNIVRDHDLEIMFYKKINSNNEKYILVHDNFENIFTIQKNYKIINLSNITNNFFEAILLLENAEEIYCIDSIWACFIYILDMKYNLFKKNIYFYCTRKHYYFFDNKKSNHFIK